MICNEVPDSLALASTTQCRSCQYIEGAAVAFGLMGMAEAIRGREHAKQRQRDHEDRMLEADMGQ